MSLHSNEPLIRQATLSDLASIVEMLADDPLGQTREQALSELDPGYLSAFEKISNDPNAEILVIEENEKIIATAQVNYIHYLTYQGGTRALIEAVRVHKNFRGRGLGELLIQTIIDQAKLKGCHMVQLTSNKERSDAIRFYEKLGFKATHEGMKLFI